MFVDSVKIYARGGNGGRGCVAFLRGRYQPKGGPCGGDGGQGGSVIMVASHDVQDLMAQYFESRLVAQNGAPGKGKDMTGRAGKDLMVKVPCGTLIHRLEGPGPRSSPRPTSDARQPAILPRARGAGPGRRRDRSVEGALPEAGRPGLHEPVLVEDLVKDGQRISLCHGGRGGLGNRHFATARHQAPRFAQPGEPGEEGNFLLELKLMADVGLIGYPNAGKSTLLSTLSRARPKIASYPFTTLQPCVGVVDYGDYFRLTVSDVPGLIEGAHRNRGLGHAFLKHVERCRILAYVIDMAATEGRNPWDDFSRLAEELELYDPRLRRKPACIIGAKMDQPSALARLNRFRRRVGGIKVIPVSAWSSQGIPRLKKTLRCAVEDPKTLAAL